MNVLPSVMLLTVSFAGFAAAWFGAHATCGFVQQRRTRALIVAPRATRSRQHWMIPVCWLALRRAGTLVEPWLPVRWRALLSRWLTHAGCGEALTPAQFAVLTGCGGFLPLLWLWRRRRRRLQAIIKGFPHCIELLALTVEAGGDLMIGLAKVVERDRPGPLRDECLRVLQAVRFGQSRRQAWQSLAERIPLAPVQAVAAALIQADRFGAPLSQVLQAQAAFVRFERFQRAERMGIVASQLVLLPVVCCILPAFFLLVVGGVFLGLGGQGMMGW